VCGDVRDYTDPGRQDTGCIIDLTMDGRASRNDRERTSDASGRRRLPGVAASLFALGVAISPLSAAAQPGLEVAPLPAPFSAGRPGADLPRGWEPVRLTAKKTPTVYSLVEDQDAVVLHAQANAAASGLAQFTVFDIRSAPVVEWRWKAGSLVDGADNRVAAKEDAPARLLFAFDGDKSQLPLVERAVFYIAEKLSGRELPYALLQYVWARRLPVGTVIEHPYTRRVRMIVVASGSAGVGKWQSFSRNVYDDYRQAFDEEPGNLTGIGVMTDTDNTGGSVEAWYGDIRFRPADR
jgi:Protein of unknown function (DUF3047)